MAWLSRPRPIATVFPHPHPPVERRENLVTPAAETLPAARVAREFPPVPRHSPHDSSDRVHVTSSRCAPAWPGGPRCHVAGRLRCLVNRLSLRRMFTVSRCHRFVLSCSCVRVITTRSIVYCSRAVNKNLPRAGKNSKNSSGTTLFPVFSGLFCRRLFSEIRVSGLVSDQFFQRGRLVRCENPVPSGLATDSATAGDAGNTGWMTTSGPGNVGGGQECGIHAAIVSTRAIAVNHRMPRVARSIAWTARAD